MNKTEALMAKLDLSLITVNRIIAVNRINISTVHTSSRQNRACWAISVKVAGKTTYRSQGKEYISDPEHVVILPKGVSYKSAFEELGECLMVEFEAEYSGESPEVRNFGIKHKNDFINSMINLERNWTFKKPAYEFYCMAGLYEMLSKLYKQELLGYYSSSKYKMIEPALKYLEENYANTELSSDDMASISGISSVYFRKLFSTVFGQSPMRYLQMVRMEKAKDMLSGDYIPISEIAESVGFKSIYHFSKTFKKITGYTPTEYAKRNQR